LSLILLTYKRITRLGHVMTRSSGNNINSHFLILFYLLISGSHACVTFHCIHREIVTTGIFIAYFTYL